MMDKHSITSNMEDATNPQIKNATNLQIVIAKNVDINDQNHETDIDTEFVKYVNVEDKNHETDRGKELAKHVDINDKDHDTNIDTEFANARGILARDSELEASASDIICVELVPTNETSIAAMNTAMDEKTWADLPSEVLMRILSFLPLRMLFQLRVVCKRWADMVQSSDFNALCFDVKAPATAPHPAISCTFNNMGFRWAVYSIREQEWQIMPNFYGKSNDDRDRKREIYVASRGLLCLLEVGELDVIQSLTIWNPMTKKETEMPPMRTSWSYPLVRIMFHSDQTDRYKLILSGNQNYHPEDARYSSTEVYDSAQGGWIQGGTLLPRLRFPFSNGAICNGAVYCFGSSPMTMYDVLLMYDIDENEWSEVDPKMPTSTYCTPHLVERDGRLLTVMHLLSGPPARVANCGIFQLDFRNNEWKLLVQMPHAMFTDFAYISSCVASGKQLCVTGNTPNQDLIVAVYCEKNEDWFWLPPCSIASSTDWIERHSMFTFSPTLVD